MSHLYYTRALSGTHIFLCKLKRLEPKIGGCVVHPLCSTKLRGLLAARCSPAPSRMAVANVVGLHSQRFGSAMPAPPSPGLSRLVRRRSPNLRQTTLGSKVMRWGWIIVRGLWPSLVLMVGGATVSILLGRLGALDASSTLERVGDWVFAAAWLAAIFWMALFWLRLKRWEAGDGPFCRTCSGPTGLVKPGRVYFGRQLSDFRRCYNCGRPTPEL